MVWGFLKKVLGKEKYSKTAPGPVSAPEPAVQSLPAALASAAKPVSAPPAPEPARAAETKPSAPPVAVKTPAQKTDEELAQELNAISPEILSQAKNPQMRKLIIDIYRRMLIEGVDINNEKEVKKWLKKHPEAVNGGETRKIETFKREEPKVGRNDICPCGSGKKYKKCCGAVGV